MEDRPCGGAASALRTAKRATEEETPVLRACLVIHLPIVAFCGAGSLILNQREQSVSNLEWRGLVDIGIELALWPACAESEVVR